MKGHENYSIESVWNEFTNQYSLQKTLRFELKPIGKDGKRLSAEDAAKVFAKILENDKKIIDAYIALKPIMDKVHEEVINESLISKEAKKIDFSNYLEKYKQKKDIASEEKALREAIVKTYDVGAQEIKKKAGNNSKGKPVLKEKGIKCLTEAGILEYVEKVISELPDEKEKEKLKGHLKTFNKFFTYFYGYNQNRENYYSKEEKATAIATRIVHDNLPKFCDNYIQFSDGKAQKKKPFDNAEEIISRKDEYLNAYKFLKDNDKITQIKDTQTNGVIEASPIDEKVFEIVKFSECLSQQGIDEYNRIIGHYNLLINLYNQARKDEKYFRKLLPFKTLYKQIGCGEKKAWFYALKYDTRKQQDAKEKTEAILNLEETLNQISKTGKKYFVKSSDESEVITFHRFINWLRRTDDWNGIYWSKAAVDKVSDRYFSNWHDIKDRIQQGLQGKDKKLKEICETIASYKKNREEQLKINDAVELSGLFEVLNQEKDKGWSKTLFKESILEDRHSLINEELTPSRNLINLICHDMEGFASDFCNNSTKILETTDFKNETNILEIKKWLDNAKSLIWIVKYFDVKESKVKGTTINPELTDMLIALLRSDDTKWFDWYDAVRNYVTKKPQENAKENKLKLNFGNPILLGGWSDGQEKSKGSVLLKNNNKYYVGILDERSLFDTAKKNNPVYVNSGKGAGRLILKNLAFKTLAGKGFVRDYNEKYSDMGKRNPNETIKKLQDFIKKNYVSQYKPLEQVVGKEYSNKKDFDNDIQHILTECYECNFTPINWDIVLQNVSNKKLYLFEIYSKDFEEKSTGKPNLQTKYWEHIFHNNSTIQLCGGGELFFREKAITDDKKVVHPANLPIKRRSDGKTESRFSHDITKDKRFTTEKYFFHVPIKLNYRTSSKLNVNEKVNDLFIQANDIQFLGIDRGEKHLIYYSLVDAKGNIIEQDHFDVVKGKDYLQEINEAAKKRREKQENWQQKGQIKNLKDGYISLVIHEIIQKMKDKDGQLKPTFIVLEYLTPGFKRGRQKFEQQVYQKFELAMAKKLNYLVDKNVADGEIGSVGKALQLTPPVGTYQDIENRKQLGIMLYSRANCTSITDPATGWRKTIYLKKGKDEDVKKQVLETFSEIGMDKNGDYFFEYEDKDTKNKWKLWSGKNGKSLERYRFRWGKSKNEGIIESYTTKEMLDKLFEDFDKEKSLLEQLKGNKTLAKIDDKNTAWESLRFVIEIIQQIRNSGDKSKNQDDNFLLSPVRNDLGEHFDSRKYPDQQNPNMPKDADANGAFNIARKGILMYEHIKQWIRIGKPKFEKTTDLNLFISDTEWDLWLLDRPKWREQLPMLASRNAKKKEEK